MSNDPRVDGRKREALLEDLTELASAYVPEWTPAPEDPGTALLQITAGLSEDVIERLDRVPHKHRVSFFDTLGFSQGPPQASRLPLTFDVADGVTENVVVPEGTQAVAEAKGNRPEQTFEIPPEGGFEATPSNLTRVYSVDRNTDRIIDHWTPLQAGNESRLFDGENIQKHMFYVGHNELFTLTAGATIEIELQPVETAKLLRDTDRFTWQFYGEREIGEQRKTDWHTLILPSESENESVVRLEFPGKTTETELSGIKSKWIRCVAAKDDPSGVPFDVRLEAIQLHVEDDELQPDKLLLNDVPVRVKPGIDSTDIYPFGVTPRLMDSFYIASEDAFSKGGTKITIMFKEATDQWEAEGDPTLSWEYWNGNAWTKLHVDDKTNDLTENDNDAEITFQCPRDVELTETSGHQGRWIRARLVSGEYVKFRYKKEVEEWVPEPKGKAPRFSNITIQYKEDDEPNHVLRENNLDRSGDLVKYSGELREPDLKPFSPFLPPRDRTQALYLGFDRALDDGPLNVYLALLDKEFPESFHPRVRWEYCTGPDRDEWTRLEAQDETENLTKRGIVSLVFPEATIPSDRFGQELHWLRARVVGDNGDLFTFETDEPAHTVQSREGSEIKSGEESPRDRAPCSSSTSEDSEAESLRLCRETVPSISRSGGPVATEEPPSLRGIYPNTGWSDNIRTITGETLGSSDGTREQEFLFATPPVITESVWVNELSTLSEEQREELKNSSDITVEEERGPRDQITAFWVRWARVEDFLGSGERSRHYTIDRGLGRLFFGDGAAGKMPPIGRDNIRADYTTGGGAAGNVKTDEVTGLVSSIPFIDGVTNPEPGDGGAEVESVAAVLSRAPRELKDRGRAVTYQDFERIALSATRRLARAKCIPGMDKNGERSAGWVTVVVIPRSGEDKPVPSPEVKERVRDTLRNRGSAPLVDPKYGRLVVRGPSYVGVSVTANVATEHIGSLSALEERAIADLRGYLHPLTGGIANEGWDFGELPCLSDFYALLEGVEGVDHVESLSVMFEGDEQTVRVAEGEPMPTIPREALIFSGTHEIQATGGV